MRLPLCHARDRLTPRDLDFVARTLGRGTREESAVLGLMADVECRDELLDRPELAKALLDAPAWVRVSPRLLFFVLLRRAFREAGLPSRELADYVAEVLSGFVEREGWLRPEGIAVGGLDFEIDVVQSLSQASGYEQFFIHVFNGDRYLFLTGLFPEFMHRREQRGGPGLRFYYERGRLSYQNAREHRLAEEFGLTDVLELLGERFDVVRECLTDLSERVLHLG